MDQTCIIVDSVVGSSCTLIIIIFYIQLYEL